MRRESSRHLTTLLLIGAIGWASATWAEIPSSEGRLASAWNELILTAAEAEDGFLTLKGLRTAALVHLGMHEALNRLDPRYATYLNDEIVAAGDPTAAATQVAYSIARDQYPDREALWSEQRSLGLESVLDPVARERGIAFGQVVADRVLAKRRGDGWNREAAYVWHPMGPGVYAEFAEHSGTPEGFVFGAGWATARPFLLVRPDQYRVAPPPAIESDEYVEAYREVKEVGRRGSQTRTPDQSHLAMWWKDFAENSTNRLARQLVADQELDLWDATRLYALLEMSLFDAYVSVFENKFHYNHWRPYTAIRWAAHDGNPRTIPDKDWDTMHGHTYAFPSYPSAHGTACAAAMAVFAATFGEDLDFTMVTPEVDRAGPFSGKVAMEPATRSFEDFPSAALECALSRVYLGIHFRYDSVAGYHLGWQIGHEAVSRYLQATD